MYKNEKIAFWASLLNPKSKILIFGSRFILLLTIFLGIGGCGTTSLVKIDASNSTFKIADDFKFFWGGHKRDIVIKDVAASRFGVRTGVTLKKDKKITLTASGLVITDTTYFKPQEEDDDSFWAKLHSLNIGWRTANGNRLNYVENENHPEMQTEHEESKTLKLWPDSEFGCLLGFVYAEDSCEKASKKVLKGKIIPFEIGVKSTIIFDKNEDAFIVQNYNEDNVPKPGIAAKLKKEFEGCEIYLVVNDCIIKKESDLVKIFSTRIPDDNTFRNKLLKQSKVDDKEIDKLCEQIKKVDKQRTCQKRIKDHLAVYRELKEPKTIYYMDNIGHFRVILEQTDLGWF